jgi:hypothetical protein
MSFKDCYKNVLNSLTDWSSFSDINAKIIDLCSDSNDEDITLYEWKPFTQAYSNYWFGNGSRYSNACYKLSFLGLPGYVLESLTAYVFKALNNQ